MKKIGIINQPISTVIAGLGHMDRIVVCDAGLPIPDNVLRIDLALKEGTPTFLETTEVILQEMKVESAIISLEMEQYSKGIEKLLKNILGNIPMDKIPHEQFKKETINVKAIIRTGEFSPYANVILIAGVVF